MGGGRRVPVGPLRNMSGVRNQKAEDKNIITLSVQALDGEEVLFRMKRSTRLKKLMTAYCDRLSVDYLHDISFMYNGRRLEPNQTPHEMGMEDQDIIGALPTQKEEDKKIIFLSVQALDGKEVLFRMKRSTRLKKLMTAYCDRQLVDYLYDISFMFNGRRVGPDQTPDEVGMEDQDIIDALPIFRA